MRVPDLLFGLSARPPDERSRPGFDAGLWGRLAALGDCPVLLQGRTGRSPAALVDVRARATLQASGIFGIPRKYPGERQEGAKNFFDVDVVFSRAFKYFYSERSREKLYRILFDIQVEVQIERCYRIRLSSIKTTTYICHFMI